MNTKMFWNRVKTCTKEKGKTQLELVNACGFTYGSFRNWMSKNVNPPLIYAHRISKYLGVSLEFLINGKGKDNVSKTNEEVILLLKKAQKKMIGLRRSE